MTPYCGSTNRSGVRLSSAGSLSLSFNVGAARTFSMKSALAFLLRVVRDRLRLALVLQPDERDVIVLHQAARAACAVGGAGNRDAGRVRGRIRERCDEVGEMPGLVDPGRIERRLSVLRADDKQRRLVDAR